MRIYKNAAGDVLAIDKIGVVVTQMSVPRQASGPEDQFTQRYHRSAVIDSVTTRINKQEGQDRVISSIWHVGNYDAFAEENGSIQQVVYLGTGESNDLPVDLNLLPQIGEEL